MKWSEVLVGQVALWNGLKYRKNSDELVDHEGRQCVIAVYLSPRGEEIDSRIPAEDEAEPEDVD